MKRKEFKDDGNLRTLTEWRDVYKRATGRDININSLRKRRGIAGVGQLVPPRTYLLTLEEFRAVLATPLPLCTKVVDAADF